METTTTIIDLIITQIEEMNSSELLELNNAFCQSANYDSDEIYENDEEFFNMFFEGKPLEAVRAANYGEYNYSDSYVKFNGYGNLDSLSVIDTGDLPDNVLNIAEHVNENREGYLMFDFDALESELEDVESED